MSLLTITVIVAVTIMGGYHHLLSFTFLVVVVEFSLGFRSFVSGWELHHLTVLFIPIRIPSTAIPNEAVVLTDKHVWPVLICACGIVLRVIMTGLRVMGYGLYIMGTTTFIRFRHPLGVCGTQLAS